MAPKHTAPAQERQRAPANRALRLSAAKLTGRAFFPRPRLARAPLDGGFVAFSAPTCLAVAMSSLRAVVETLVSEGGDFCIEAPADWGQGRTLYGGMTAALAHEAVRRAFSELPPLRSAQFMFVGPASGRLKFGATLLRRGRSSTIIAADCANQDGPALRATFVFGAARQSKLAHLHLEAPHAPEPQACSPFRKQGPNAPPGFWNNFETRLAAGGRLFDASASKPEFAVWTRFLDAGDADPTTALLAMADCLPPAAMVQFPAPAPISTMTWTLDIAQTPQNPEAWSLLWARSEAAREGYSFQNMAMWNESGGLVAVGRQAVAIFA
jgi:acyl-CoA thioesterase